MSVVLCFCLALSLRFAILGKSTLNYDGLGSKTKRINVMHFMWAKFIEIFVFMENNSFMYFQIIKEDH